MIKIGLTGGIGTGKTTVANIFREFGVPVFFADDEAKKFLFEKDIILQLVSYFGSSILVNQNIDRKALAKIVFNDTQSLQILNNILHPLIRMAFKKWCKEHENKPYVIIEAAILFENGFNKMVDKTIVIVAPLDDRIERTMNRDAASRTEVEARIRHQWPQEKLINLADFVIDNSEDSLVIPQIIEINEILIF